MNPINLYEQKIEENRVRATIDFQTYASTRALQQPDDVSPEIVRRMKTSYIFDAKLALSIARELIKDRTISPEAGAVMVDRIRYFTYNRCTRATLNDSLLYLFSRVRWYRDECEVAFTTLMASTAPQDTAGTSTTFATATTTTITNYLSVSSSSPSNPLPVSSSSSPVPSTRLPSDVLDPMKRARTISAADLVTARVLIIIPTDKLTADQKATIASTITDKKDDTQVVNRIVGWGDISIHDLLSLDDKRWNNDSVLGAVAGLIVSRPSTFEGSQKLRGVYVFTSPFYNKYVAEGHDAVKGWTTRGERKVDLFSFCCVFFIINIGRMHWIMVAAHMKFKHLVLYDSLGNLRDECVRTVFQYLHEEFLAKKGDALDFQDWQVYCCSSSPRQQNSYDCGPITMININLIASVYQSTPLDDINEPPFPAGYSTATEDILRVRQQNQLDLIRGKLFPEPDI
jgi:hypothetical protein